MRVLIRFLSHGPSGTVEYRDKEFLVETITLGRATDQTLHIRDRSAALQHARIERKGKHFQIVSESLTGVIVNDSTCRDSRITTGDVIRIGQNILTVIDASEGFDLALTFELEVQARAEEVAVLEHVMSLENTRLGKRRASWWLVTVILTIFLFLPLLGYTVKPLTQFMRDSMLPSDKLWSSGPLHPAHLSIGNDCSGCHVALFRRVGNSQCAECHSDVTHHVDPDVIELSALMDARCASCHREHNEPSQIIQRRESLCVDCHNDESLFAANDLDALPVGGFQDAHPQFRLSILAPPLNADDGEDWAVRRISRDAVDLTEQSNLTFPHDAHLDPAGVKAPEGTVVLDCDGCHRTGSGGGLMEHMQFETHCQGCHTLEFDASDPDRQVPHGDPAQVMLMLEEYYSRQLVMERESPGNAATSGGRRPGRAPSTPERNRALTQARQQAQAAAQELFERRACSVCHEVDGIPDSGPESGWTVTPVRITSNWLPRARFDHTSHRRMECSECHRAAESDKSSDVLIPGIENCRECHSRVRSAGTGLNTCITCHDFHQADAEFMAP